MKLNEILTLSSHGPDTYVGVGPRYPWGGLYGGQIVAQALAAAAATVDDHLMVHSLRAYFIRRGDQDEPVRYEVDRIRNGRSFATRRVVARQAIGAILNLEASFQAIEESPDLDVVTMDRRLSAPGDLESTSWTPVFERAFLPTDELEPDDRLGAGRAAAWMRTSRPVGESTAAPADLSPSEALAHFAALAYLSDDLPTDAVIRAHPVAPSRRRCATRCSSRRASITRSGSTGRCVPTSGISTTSPVTASSAVVASASATSSRRQAPMSRRWPRKCCCGTPVAVPDRTASAPAQSDASPVFRRSNGGSDVNHISVISRRGSLNPSCQGAKPRYATWRGGEIKSLSWHYRTSHVHCGFRCSSEREFRGLGPSQKRIKAVERIFLMWSRAAIAMEKDWDE